MIFLQCLAYFYKALESLGEFWLVNNNIDDFMPNKKFSIDGSNMQQLGMPIIFCPIGILGNNLV